MCVCVCVCVLTDFSGYFWFSCMEVVSIHRSNLLSESCLGHENEKVVLYDRWSLYRGALFQYVPPSTEKTSLEKTSLEKTSFFSEAEVIAMDRFYCTVPNVTASQLFI